MKMIKRIICGLLATVLLFGAVGCDLEEPQDNGVAESATTTTATAATTTAVVTTTTEAVTTTTEATTTATEETTAQQTTVKTTEAKQEAEPMVWIPQSGSKYHSKASCSKMKNPSHVSLSYAQREGYTPCKKCY